MLNLLKYIVYYQHYLDYYIKDTCGRPYILFRKNVITREDKQMMNRYGYVLYYKVSKYDHQRKIDISRYKYWTS